MLNVGGREAAPLTRTRPCTERSAKLWAPVWSVAHMLGPHKAGVEAGAEQMAWDLGAQDRIPQGLGVQSAEHCLQSSAVSGLRVLQLRAGELEFPKIAVI